MSAVLAVDIGGSALKACLFTLKGEEIASASTPLAFVEDYTGRSEQDPEVWWSAFRHAVEEIAGSAASRLANVVAVTACGATRTQVLLDAHYRVVRPAIGFRDSRAAGFAAELAARAEAARQPIGRHFNAYHPLARLIWLKHEEPESFAAIRLVLDPKDYLNLRLTGQAMSDRVSHYWLSNAMRGGANSLATSLGLDKNPLPPLGHAWDSVGRVVDGLPGALARLAGARVMCGSNDTWSAVAGLGALRPGYAYCISGSSEVFGLIAEREATAEGLITIPWGSNLWHIGGPGQNGANTLTWLVDLLDRRDLPFGQRLEELLGQGGPPQAILFHPFIHGERTPFWDTELRAAFLGLGATHRTGDLVRAAMEGIGFVNRVVLERAEHAAGQEAMEVRIAGGGGRSPTWNQIRADILQRPVLASPMADTGLLGCLAVARVGLGVDPDIVAAADVVARDVVRFAPDRRHRARYDALFAVFQQTHAVIAEASRQLARIGRGEHGGPLPDAAG